MSYRDEVIRLANPNLSYLGKLGMGGMGLAGEAGEVCDLLKKTIFYNKDLDREKLIQELGDVRWYMEYLMILADTTIEEVERVNVEKLTTRYPNGYSNEAAVARKDQP